MTETENKNPADTGQTPSTTDTGRTPSMAASLLVCGVMIGLIMLSVVFFGSDVAEGPLQVSMTLATLLVVGGVGLLRFVLDLISEGQGCRHGQNLGDSYWTCESVLYGGRLAERS